MQTLTFGTMYLWVQVDNSLQGWGHYRWKTRW